jgi:hypothetical protein
MKKKIENQIGNLIFEHSNLGNMGQMTFDRNVWHGIEKISLGATTL